MATSSLGTKAGLSAGKAAEVSPCSSLCSGEGEPEGRMRGIHRGKGPWCFLLGKSRQSRGHRDGCSSGQWGRSRWAQQTAEAEGWKG